MLQTHHTAASTLYDRLDMQAGKPLCQGRGTFRSTRKHGKKFLLKRGRACEPKELHVRKILKHGTMFVLLKGRACGHKELQVWKMLQEDHKG